MPRRSKARASPALARSCAVPILCKFWSEDGVWNGVAEHLPVAVFGDTFEEAQRNLLEAVSAHLEAVREHGDLEATFEHLRQCATDFLSISDIPTGHAYARFEARFMNERVCAFA